MNKEKYIATIIEGSDFEKRIIKSIRTNFFSGKDKTSYIIIPVPSRGTIYQLWNELKKDEYLDVIELMKDYNEKAQKILEDYDRNSFSEVYLFFDYDAHHNNLSYDEETDDVLLKMLTFFDNETENGKLYISYPMGEAVRDCKIGLCESFSGSCYYDKMIGREYKTLSSNNNPLSHISQLTQNRWADFINTYRGRLSCLFDEKSLLSLPRCKDISTTDIFQKQSESEKIIVLSAFSEFLIDYFTEEYINELLKSRNFTCCVDNCKNR